MSTGKPVRQFIMKRGRVATPSQMFEDDLVVIKNLADRRVAERLGRLLNPDIAYYARAVNELYKDVVEAGGIEGAEKVKQAAVGASTSAGLYWGGYLDVRVEVLPAESMLEAENQLKQRINHEIGASKFRPLKLPSPSFVDHLEGKIVLSDKYIFLYPKKGAQISGDVYATGGADAVFYPWNEYVLRVQAVNDASNLIMRHLRGETGNNYARMLKDFPQPVIAAANRTLGAVNSYALPKISRNGGIPVLYRRNTDIFRSVDEQRQFVAAKAVADDMGADVASMFDGLDLQPSQAGSVVVGYLWGSHPNNAYKERKITEAVSKLPYQVLSASVPEDFLRRFM